MSVIAASTTAFFTFCVCSYLSLVYEKLILFMIAEAVGILLRLIRMGIVAFVSVPTIQ